MLEQFVRSVIALLAILNPIGAVPVFLSLGGMNDTASRLRAARTAAFAVCTILLLSAVAGRWVLAGFGLELSALRAGGGLVIVLMGLEMLRGEPTRVQHDNSNSTTNDNVVVPFAMPTVAGPGAITTAITLAANRRGLDHAAMTGATIVTASAIVFAVLVLASRVERFMNPRAQRILLRFMGLILVSLGAQFVLGGAYDFWTQR
ncbi:MAG: MarC family protein [Polyangiales bacterium]